jgi:ABC-type transport system substrate-binding protein
MNLHRTKTILFVFIFFLSACANQAQVVPPALPSTETSAPPTVTLPSPTETSAPPTQTPTNVPTETATDVSSNTDPALFGALAKSEINPLASKIHEAIFIKIMDGFIANGNVIEYQIIASEVFPSETGLIAEITYNVRTTDPSWLVDGGTPADDNWIQNKCNRFDFVNTEAEFQLKNRRTCN